MTVFTPGRWFLWRAYPEAGQGLVEYALILVLVAVVVIGVLAAIGPAIGEVYANIVIALNDTPSFADLAAVVQGCVTDPGAKNPLLNIIVDEDVDAFKAMLETKKNKMTTGCYGTLKSLTDRM